MLVSGAGPNGGDGGGWRSGEPINRGGGELER
jgi:hypothetical protein